MGLPTVLSFGIDEIPGAIDLGSMGVLSSKLYHEQGDVNFGSARAQ